MSMMTFAWAPRSVESKIKKLPKADRRVARAALNHLLSCQDSDYGTFYDKHLDFLRRHGKMLTRSCGRGHYASSSKKVAWIQPIYTKNTVHLFKCRF